ncbi:MAG: hypothetical protein CM1200mP28_18130 [Deltaproteobacteria bacterium]|nr:MAG: hypothetical protein CM1200mP28_18130 [Deltaproteobacteria bacterium]
MGLGWVTTMIQQGLVGLASIQTVLQQKLSRSHLKSLTQTGLKSLFAENRLTVDNLSYRYPLSNKDTLKNVSFNIKARTGNWTTRTYRFRQINSCQWIEPLFGHGKRVHFCWKQDLAELSDNDIRTCIRKSNSRGLFCFQTLLKTTSDFLKLLMNQKVQNIFPKNLRSAAMEEEVGRFPRTGKNNGWRKRHNALRWTKAENQPGKGYVETLQPADSG